MTKYLLTGLVNGSVITLQYAAEGLAIVDMSAASHLDFEQRNMFLRNVPTNAALLPAFCKNRFNLKEETVEVTFELFYDAYGHKKGKNEAQRAFSRLSRADRQRAYHYIAIYNRDLQVNTWKTKMYPATYLNKKIWED